MSGRTALLSVVPSVFVATILLLVSFSPALAAGGSCRAVKLSPKPAWVSSAAWLPGGKQLLAVESLTSRVLSFDTTGRQHDVTQEYRGLEDFFPVAVRTITTAGERQQLLQLTKSRFRVVSAESASSLVSGFDVMPPEQGEPKAPLPLARSSSRDSSIQVEKLWQFELVGKPESPLSEHRLVGFADVSQMVRGQKEWSFDLVSVPWGARDGASVVSAAEFKAIEHDDPIRTYFRLGYPLMAMLGNDAYVLRMEEFPVIYALENAPEGRTNLLALEGLDLGRRAALPRIGRFSQTYPVLMAALVNAGSKVPMALFGQGQLLYVLFRELVADGSGTRWSLQVIDPYDQAGEYLRGEAVLEGVTAEHLTVVPGDAEWAFLEKGPVKELFARQDIPSMTLVPTEQITRISRDAESGGLTKLCL